VAGTSRRRLALPTCSVNRCAPPATLRPHLVGPFLFAYFSHKRFAVLDAKLYVETSS
jgi:hypothetical protein